MSEYRVLNPDLDLDDSLPKHIIAGFPGVGKSTAALQYPNLFIDMESSDYHWITDDHGNKVANPEWPENYIDAIINTASDDTTDPIYVLTSTHREVLDALDKRKLYYCAVLPLTKDIYIGRYRERGNTEEFIEKLDKNFDSFIESVKSTKVFAVYETDGYLVDCFVETKADNNRIIAPEMSVETNIHDDAIVCMTLDFDNLKIFPMKQIFVVYKNFLFTPEFYKGEMNNHLFEIISAERFMSNPDGREDYFIDNMKRECSATDKPYIVVMASTEIINKLHENKCMFTLVLPKTFDPKDDPGVELHEYYNNITNMVALSPRVLYTQVYLDILMGAVSSVLDVSMINVIHSFLSNKLNNEIKEDSKTAKVHKYLSDIAERASKCYTKVSEEIVQNGEDDADCFCDD